MPPVAVTLNLIIYVPNDAVSNVADIQATDVSLTVGHIGYVIPDIRMATSYAKMGQLLSSVLNVFTLYTFGPVANSYAKGSAESVPGGVITTADEHGTTIVPLKVLNRP